MEIPGWISDLGSGFLGGGRNGCLDFGLGFFLEVSTTSMRDWNRQLVEDGKRWWWTTSSAALDLHCNDLTQPVGIGKLNPLSLSLSRWREIEISLEKGIAATRHTLLIKYFIISYTQFCPLPIPKKKKKKDNYVELQIHD